MKNEILESIRELYRVFSPYRSSAHPVGCPCCVRYEDSVELFSRPLERLDADELWKFSRKVMTTWGDVRDLKHFLPRMLELLVENTSSHCDIEVVFGKLRLAEWRDWPAIERAAVKGFIDTAWRRCMREEDAAFRIDEWLSAFGCAGCELSPILSVWENCQCAPGYEGLRRFIDDQAIAILKRRGLAKGFWAGALVEQEKIVDWLLSPSTVARLTTTFDEHADADFADELALLIDRIALLQQASEG